MDYFQNMDAFWKRILIAFLVFQGIIAIIIIIKLCYFMKTNPRELLQEKFSGVLAFRFFYLLFDVWAEIMFWILFFTAGYWFVTFKL